MNISNQDIEYLLSLKKVGVDTTSPGLSALYKYISSPYNVSSNLILQGNDKSYIQLTNVGNSTLKMNNELIKTSSVLDNVLLFRITETPSSNLFNVHLSFNDILFYKNISIEIDFGIHQNAQLNVYLPQFLDNDTLTTDAIDFLKTYRQKYQIETIPSNYIFSHIVIKSTKDTTISIHRYDNEPKNVVQMENVYVIQNSFIYKLFSQVVNNNESVIVEDTNRVKVGDKYLVYNNIPLNESLISKSRGLFFSRDDCFFTAFKFADVQHALLDKFNKLFGLVLGNKYSIINNLNKLYQDKENLKGSLYPKHLFQLYNGYFCGVYDSSDYRNKALEIVKRETSVDYSSQNIRESLVTIRITALGTSNLNGNQNMLQQLSKFDFINLSMDPMNIWVTIKNKELNLLEQILSKNKINFSIKAVKIETCYLSNYKKKLLLALTKSVQNYILCGMNKEIIVSSEQFIKPVEEVRETDILKNYSSVISEEYERIRRKIEKNQMKLQKLIAVKPSN